MPHNEREVRRALAGYGNAEARLLRAATPKALQSIRKLNGLTQEQLAARMNYHRVTVAKVECGTEPISIDYIKDMIHALNKKNGYQIRTQNKQQSAATAQAATKTTGHQYDCQHCKDEGCERCVQDDRPDAW